VRADVKDKKALLDRITSLDGLRGLAAAIVVVHHTMLLFPFVAKPYLASEVGVPFSLAWWFIASPLHLLWDGNAAVYLFFVLSGFVLFLPVLRTGDFSWLAYYPKRLLRLYLPIWAAVSIAAISIAVVPRLGDLSSPWVVARSHEVTIGALARDVTLILGHGGLVSPLWSLRWEILFSLALPLYVAIALFMKKFFVAKVAFCLALVALGGFFEVSSLQYLPMFLLGGLIAVEHLRITTTIERHIARTGSQIGFFLVLVLALVLVMAPWWARALGASRAVEGALSALVLFGTCLLVILAINWQLLRVSLSGPLFGWLGRISFSLYLVHEPIILAIAFLLGSDWLLLSWTISLPAAFVAAWAFFKWVERPSHLLARRLEGRRPQRSTAHRA
jgi:peptidoglycan/LPS O-acetylase OafA/YrhL